MAPRSFPEYSRWDLFTCLDKISQQSHKSAPTAVRGMLFISIIGPTDGRGMVFISIIGPDTVRGMVFISIIGPYGW